MSKVIAFLSIVLVGLLIVGTPTMQSKMHMTRFDIPDNLIGGLFVAIVVLIAVKWLFSGIGKKVGGK
jgi:Na+/glutamate symporter